MCVRITSHSSDDDQRRYRAPEEIEALKAKDPINRMRTYLTEHDLLDEAGLKGLETKVAAQINDATDWAEAQPMAPGEFALTHVYAEEE